MSDPLLITTERWRDYELPVGRTALLRSAAARGGCRRTGGAGCGRRRRRTGRARRRERDRHRQGCVQRDRPADRVDPDHVLGRRVDGGIRHARPRGRDQARRRRRPRWRSSTTRPDARPAAGASAGTSMNALAHCAEGLYSPGGATRRTATRWRARSSSRTGCRCGRGRNNPERAPAPARGRDARRRGAARRDGARARDGAGARGRYGLAARHDERGLAATGAALQAGTCGRADRPPRRAMDRGDDAIGRVAELARSRGRPVARLRRAARGPESLAEAIADRGPAKDNPRPAPPEAIRTVLEEIW